MPSPKPIPVIRFIENTEVSVTWVETQTKKNEPRIAKPPTISGKPEATTEPKTKISRMTVSGTAIDSAVRMSFSIE